MLCSFRKVFCPTKEERLESALNFLKIHKECARDKGCATCTHCHRVINLPGFVTGEEYECDVGLECDTVFFSVKNCPKWDEDMSTYEIVEMLKKEM